MQAIRDSTTTLAQAFPLNATPCLVNDTLGKLARVFFIISRRLAPKFCTACTNFRAYRRRNARHREAAQLPSRVAASAEGVARREPRKPLPKEGGKGGPSRRNGPF